MNNSLTFSYGFFQGVEMKRSLLFATALLIFTSCSGSRSVQKVSDEAPQIELSSTESLDNSNDILTEDDFMEGDSINSGVGDQVVAEQPLEEPMSETPVEEAGPMIEGDPSLMNQSASQEMTINDQQAGEEFYTVQKNETLMMVAFKLYGDYSRWREIADRNQGALNGSTMLKEGMQLSYLSPPEKFEWNPEGLPYLIKTGDTLSGISREVYANANKWRYIWDNNRPLIKDPNKIYAGFTLYYLENGREVANQ